MRKWTIRLGDMELFASERSQSDSMETFLIPRLERELGPNHRSVKAARRRAQELRDAEVEELRAAMRSVADRDP